MAYLLRNVSANNNVNILRTLSMLQGDVTQYIIIYLHWHEVRGP